MNGLMIHNKQGLAIPGRRLAIIDVSIDIDQSMNDRMFEVRPNFLLINEHPNLVMIPVMTDNISCPTHKFPSRKLNTRLTVLQFIVKQNLTTNHI